MVNTLVLLYQMNEQSFKRKFLILWGDEIFGRHAPLSRG